MVSREAGSGTRGAFVELVGIKQKDADGNKVDCTTDEASITNSTSVMNYSTAEYGLMKAFLLFSRFPLKNASGSMFLS